MTTIQTRSKTPSLTDPNTTNFKGCFAPGEVWKETRNHRYVIRVSPLSASYQPQSKQNKVQFDFDASSRSWRANKRATGNGGYSYLDEPIPERNERPQRACRSPVRYQA